MSCHTLDLLSGPDLWAGLKLRYEGVGDEEGSRGGDEGSRGLMREVGGDEGVGG